MRRMSCLSLALQQQVMLWHGHGSSRSKKVWPHVFYHCVVGVCVGKRPIVLSICCAYWNLSVSGNLCFNYSSDFPKEVG